MDRSMQFLLRALEPAVAQPIADAEPTEAIALIEALAPLEMPAAHYAAGALLELGPAAAPALKRWVLAHGHRGLLWATLEDAADPGPGLDAFGELLDEDDSDLVAAAAAAVGKCGAPGLRYSDRLRALAETGPDSWVRSHALRALGQVGAKRIDVLVKATREGDDEERLAAVAAIELLGPNARHAVDAVCECLGHADPRIVTAATFALIRIGERSARVGDALAAAFDRTGDPDECARILHAIGRLGAPSSAAQSALDRALRNRTTRAAAAVADYLVTGEPADLRAMLPDVAWTLREWRVDPGPVADVLLRLLGERARNGAPAGTGTMAAMLKAMENLKPEQLMIGGEMTEAMTTELDPSAVVADIADSLIPLAQRLGDPAAIPALESIAADEACPPWTREMAAEAAKSLRGAD